MIGLFLTLFLSIFLLMVLFVNVEFFFILNLFFTAIFSALRLDPRESGIDVLGVSVYFNDIFFISQIIFLLFFVFRQLSINKDFLHSNYLKVSTLILLIVVVKIFYSSIFYGTSAIVGGRHFLFFFSNILFFSIYKLPEERILNIYKGIFYISIIYISIGSLRYMGFLPGIYSNWLDIINFSDSFSDNRIFEKPDLEVLIVGAFFSLSQIISKFSKRISIWVPIFLFQSLFILFSNTRSIVGIFLLILFFGFFKNYFINNKKIFFLLIILFPLFLIFMVSFLGEGYSIDNLFGEDSTFIFRAFVTLAFISYMNASAYFFGMNFGDAPVVFPEVYYTQYMGGMMGLHNAYVEIFYFMGLPFLLFILKLTFDLIKRLYYIVTEDSSILGNASFFSITACLILFLAWPITQFSGLLFGLAIASVKCFEEKERLLNH